MEEEFKKLIRNNEFEQIIQLLENKASNDDIDRIETMIDEQVKTETIDELREELATKANTTDLEQMFDSQSKEYEVNYDKILGTTQGQLSSLTDSINEQFELVREDFYEKLSTKLDSSSVLELTTKLAKKADNERVNTLIAQHKNNLIDILENYKKEFRSMQDLFEQKYKSTIGMV